MLSRAEELALVRVAAGRTDVGQRRAHNEDSILVRPDLGLFLVADGAGGHAAGEVASQLCASVVADFFQTTHALCEGTPDYDDFGFSTGERRLARAVKKANLEILNTAAQSKVNKGMGTTVVAASVSARSGVVHVAHVGDSRCYRLRAGHLESLTQDHSLIVDVLELRPDLDDASLAKVPTNVITRAVGVDPNVRVSIRSHKLDADDRFLLCSDGLWGLLSHQGMARLLAESPGPEQAVEELIKAANEAGGDDNISAIVFFCGGTSQPAASTGVSRPGRASSRPNRDESTPEIMVFGIEEVDLDSNAPPRRNAAPQERAAADANGPPPAQPMNLAPEDDICRVCKSHFDSEFCPFCGTRREALAI
jgi:protein phosphatase